MGSSLIKSSKKNWDRVSPHAVGLTEEFFARNTLKVAQDLLGKILVIRLHRQVTAGRIVETEAYRKDDPACHAYIGETPRNSVLFGDPGRIYVYFIYGMYEMLNLVTEPRGHPAAVLIRAVEPLFGIEAMRARRPGARSERELTNGPGKLARAMGVELVHKGETAFGPKYFVLDDGYQAESISASPRVGIVDGTDFYWRYFITGHPCVSKAPQNKLSRRASIRDGSQVMPATLRKKKLK